MKNVLIYWLLFFTAVSFLMGAKKNDEIPYPKLFEYVKSAEAEFDKIPSDRKETLKKLSSHIKDQVKDDKPVNLTFICTHNSRRSHMSQIWAQIAAAYYSVPNVTTYSGGTEATAFNPRAVAACKRAGLDIVQTTKGENPIYHTRFCNENPPITNFSKVYNYAPNPTKDFCAVMTCSSADKGCPMVHGANFRIAITYIDPKKFDGTELESAKYDERCRQICREMLYVFSQVKK